MKDPLPGDWRKARAARLPLESLSALAPLRDRDEIRVHFGERECWVTWGESHLRIVALLLSAPGVEFAYEEKGQWFRVSSRLPLASGPPRHEGKRLSQLLVPQKFTALRPETEPTFDRLPLMLVRGGPPQSAAAIRCRLRDLLHWSDGATSFQLRSLRGAFCDDEVLLLGSVLPTVADATRFWGNDQLLVPVGFRVEPNLPTETIRSIFGILDEELLILEPTSAESIRRELFRPLTRAGLRQANSK